MAEFKAYRTVDGRLATSQAAAGKGAVAITVPWGKAELVDWINKAVDEARAAEAQDQHEHSFEEDRPIVLRNSDNHMETQPQAWPDEGLYHSIAQGRTQGVDRVCGLIFSADPITLSRYATSVSMGYERLAKGGK